jgi:hypothetical protein
MSIKVENNACCPTVVPTVKISISGAGMGCAPSVPRDLEGEGLFVEQFVYISSGENDNFNGPDYSGNVLNCNPDTSFVLVNGVLLSPGDYTLTATNLNLDLGAVDKDIVTIQSFKEASSSDDLNKRVQELEEIVRRLTT